MNKYLITFNGKTNKNQIEIIGGKNVEVMKTIDNIAIADLTQFQADKLMEMDNIVDVELDSSDEMQSQEIPYYLETMGYSKYHNIGVRGKGVKIAVFDSGVQPHEDLNIAGGVNVINPNETYLTDNTGHGTRVAGVINMQDNNVGYLGIAPDAELYVVKGSTDSGSFTISSQIQGLEWAINNGIDIVNMSYSSRTKSTARYEAYKKASEAGLFLITAAGNQGNQVSEGDNTGTIANMPFTITVGGLNQDGLHHRRSNKGSIDFVAPYSYIPTTDIDEGSDISTKYISPSGTSYATPIVAGIFALYLEMFPNLKKDEIIHLVRKNATPMGDRNLYGYGLPNFPDMNMLNVEEKTKIDGVWKTLNPYTIANNVMGENGKSVQDILNLLDMHMGFYEDRGHYVKFGNGLLICWASPFTQSCDTPYGQLYRSDSKTWYFPIAFDTNYPIFVSADTNSNARWAMTGGTVLSGERVQIRQLSVGQNVSEIRTHTFAIGRWK